MGIDGVKLTVGFWPCSPRAACAIRLGAFTSNSEARAYGLKVHEGCPLPRTRLASLEPPVEVPGLPLEAAPSLTHKCWGQLAGLRQGSPPCGRTAGLLAVNSTLARAQASICGGEIKCCRGYFGNWGLGHGARKLLSTRRRFHQLHHAVPVPAESPPTNAYPANLLCSRFGQSLTRAVHRVPMVLHYLQ